MDFDFLIFSILLNWLLFSRLGGLRWESINENITDMRL